MSIDHERFMRRSLELAVMARDQGNTPVGSVVVLDGAIIGEGIETLKCAPGIGPPEDHSYGTITGSTGLGWSDEDTRPRVQTFAPLDW